jgi:hypothetical protein
VCRPVRLVLGTGFVRFQGEAIVLEDAVDDA